MIKGTKPKNYKRVESRFDESRFRFDSKGIFSNESVSSDEKLNEKIQSLFQGLESDSPSLLELKNTRKWARRLFCLSLLVMVSSATLVLTLSPIAKDHELFIKGLLLLFSSGTFGMLISFFLKCLHESSKIDQYRDAMVDLIEKENSSFIANHRIRLRIKRTFESLWIEFQFMDQLAQTQSDTEGLLSQRETRGTRNSDEEENDSEMESFDSESGNPQYVSLNSFMERRLEEAI